MPTGYYEREPEDVRFWAKVAVPEDPYGSDACWLWTAGVTTKGYGKFRTGWDNATRSYAWQPAAHNYSWIHYYGEIPEGLLVCHACDVRLCVRPDHLFLGTPQENTDDMWEKGRGSRGEQLPQHVVTEAEVKLIRQYAAEGYTHAGIASVFGVQREAIGKIVRRERWKHVE